MAQAETRPARQGDGATAEALSAAETRASQRGSPGTRYSPGSLAAERHVCPECGSPAGQQPFCANCGLNLGSLERLPSQTEWSRERVASSVSNVASALETMAQRAYAVGRMDPGACRRQTPS